MTTMMSMEAGGLTLCTVGWLATILACALPMWRVTSFLGSSIAAAQVCTQGLWMSCVTESTGQMHCKGYDSLMDLTPDLQIARGMVVTALFLCVFALFLYLAGGNFTRCMDYGRIRNRFSAAAGTLFLTCGVLVMIAVSMTTDSINSAYAMVPEAGTQQLGAAVYIGWAASFFLLFGGLFMCRAGGDSQEDSYPTKYKGVKTCEGCPMRDYV